MVHLKIRGRIFEDGNIESMLERIFRRRREMRMRKSEDYLVIVINLRNTDLDGEDVWKISKLFAEFLNTDSTLKEFPKKTHIFLLTRGYVFYPSTSEHGKISLRKENIKGYKGARVCYNLLEMGKKWYSIFHYEEPRIIRGAESKKRMFGYLDL